jgi:hypothetical protein
MLVVVVAVVMWESPQRFPRAWGKGGKTVLSFSHAFHSPSFPRPLRFATQSLQRFLLLSSVRRKRKDSVPVSMMWARSVIRSSSALQSRGFGNTVVHSENGKLVVTIMAARSARSEITWKRNSAPMSARGTYPTSSSAISSYFASASSVCGPGCSAWPQPTR